MPFFAEILASIQEEQSSMIQQKKNQSQNTRLVVSVTSPQWNTSGTPIRFSLTLGQSQVTDATMIWSLIPPLPFRTSSDMGIAFEKQYIVLTNIVPTSSYPTNIYIAIDNFPGFYNSNGIATGNVLKYGLKRITPSTQTPTTLNIEYQAPSTRWILGKFIRLLNFRVFYDDNPTAQTTPLPFQLPCQFGILRNPFDRSLQNDIEMKSGYQMDQIHYF